MLHVAPGQIFAADFRIVRMLAEGGMGAVYIAEQLSTGQQRALKLMQPKLLPDVKSRERFLQEARIGSRIDSEHVVQVLAAGVDEPTGIPWLAMELLDGSDLDALVREQGPRPAAEVLDLFEQLCHALGEAHDKGIIHRDLKPENLFLARTKRRGGERVLKVLDFGIAQITDLNRSGAVVTSAIGSPLWMAPEQAMPGAKLKPATDVWAMGLIAFYLLTGKSYWLSVHQETFSLPSLLTEILQLPIVPAMERAHAVGGAPLPPGFDVWLAQAIDRDPNRRFPNARAAFAALKAALSVSPFGATQPVTANAWSTPAPVQTREVPPVHVAPLAQLGPAPQSVPSYQAAPARSGPPVIPIALGLGAVAVLAATVLGLAIVFSQSSDEERIGPAREPPDDCDAPRAGESFEAFEARCSAPDYDAALSACRRAIESLDLPSAIAGADRALGARPGDADATACRNEALALEEQGETFDRAVAQLRAGDSEQAYFTCQSLPAESPYRRRPECPDAARAYADEQLDRARALISDDPREAARIARAVLLMSDITESHRNFAGSLQRAAEANAPIDEEPPREDLSPAEREAQARRCAMAGDNACVIETLEGHASTEPSMVMLIESYRARGNTSAALRHMRVYVERFPESPRARSYQTILSAH